MLRFRPASALALFAVIGAHSSRAHAQRAIEPEEVRIEAAPSQSAPPGTQPGTQSADDSVAREGEQVIVVHELPPQPRFEQPTSAQPRRPGTPPAQLPVLAREQPDTDEQRQRDYAPGILVGVNAGVGGPSGLLGAFVEASLIRQLAVRVGAGIGLNFGPSLEAAVLVRPVRFGRFAPLLSLTYSNSFTPSSWTQIAGLQSDSNSHWLTPAIGLELRLRPIIVLRLHVGAAVMMNTGSFSNVANGGWWGPDRPPTFIGYSPLSAADAHDAGAALVTPAVWFDFALNGPHW